MRIIDDAEVHVDDRTGEFGVIGAEQEDESHFDTRQRSRDDDDADTTTSEADEHDSAALHGRVVFSRKKLYGRDKELATCMDMFRSMQDSSSSSHYGKVRSIFLSGYSGSGKSSIIQEFIKQASSHMASQDQILVLSAKYEATQNPAPFGAFRTIFDRVDSRVAGRLQEVKVQLEDVLGDDTKALLKIFPVLRRISSDGDDQSVASTVHSDQSLLPGESSHHRHHYMEAKMNADRLHFVVKVFFQSLCTPKQPLILWLDDLQWADEQSLQLLHALLTDGRLKHLLFLGSYRSNEVDQDHILNEKLINRLLGKEENDLTTVLELQELTATDIGEFLADSLHLSVAEVEPLTQAIYSKTMGNPFFTEQAVEQLVRKNAIYYDTITFAWSWNLQQAELEEELSDDLLAMVQSKMEHLPEAVRQVLVLASCTRSTFDVETLVDLSQCLSCRPSDSDPPNREAVVTLLDQAVKEGLLTPSKVNPGDEYSFSHDRIREAAHSFVSSNDQEDFLACVGNHLYERALSQHGEDWMFFAAAQHLNPILPRTKRDRRLRAEVNLHTAQLSLLLLAFQAASDACLLALECLPKKTLWDEEYYSLALKLHSIAAEAQLRAGHAEEAEKHCLAVLDHKKCTTDAIPVYKVYLDILSGKGEKEKVLELNLFILSELGLSFPKGTRMQKIRAWSMLKKVKAKYILSQNDIEHLYPATDPLSMDIMDFLQKAGSNAYASSNTSLYVLVCMESIHGITRYGLTDSSATALATFANVLMHVYDDFETSVRLAELAIALTKRLKNKSYLVRSLNTANNNVLGWVRPIRSRLPFHLQAYEWACVSGNVEGAAASQLILLTGRLYAGMPLGRLESDLRTVIAEMRHMGHDFMAHLACIVWQVTLNLLGKSKETVRLVGQAMDENDVLYSRMPFKMLHQAWRSFVFVMFGDFESGAHDALERGDSYPKNDIGMMYGFETFHRGICLYAHLESLRSASSQYRRTFKVAALAIRKQLHHWVDTKGCVNLAGPTRLIDAEHAAIFQSNKPKLAKTLYEQAIDLCAKGDFYQYQGLCHERYAYFLSSAEAEPLRSKLFLRQLESSVECYQRWGATKKVQLLQAYLATIGHCDSPEESPC